MKAKLSKWMQATANLRARRAAWGHNDDNRKIDNKIRDYRTHIEKCGYGESILDVGCGSQYLKKVLPEGVKYYGLDAFPIEGIDCFECAIEDFKGYQFDTVCAFAVLDNCRDFYAACDVMKLSARKNVIILTGIGIDPDEYHTFRLEHEHFETAFNDWDCTHREELEPKVWLLCYSRK